MSRIQDELSSAEFVQDSQSETPKAAISLPSGFDSLNGRDTASLGENRSFGIDGSPSILSPFGCLGSDSLKRELSPCFSHSQLLYDQPTTDVSMEEAGTTYKCSASARSTISYIQAMGPEMYADLKRSEAQIQISLKLKRQPVSPFLRSRMVDWMVEIFEKNGSMKQTLFIAVRILDRCLTISSASMSIKDFEILGIAAMLVASKFNDVSPLSLESAFDHIAHREFTKAQIAEKELEVLTLLQFKVMTATALEFFEFYIFMLFEQTEDLSAFKSIGHFFLELTQYDHVLCEHSPSLQAASALFAALKAYKKTYKVKMANKKLYKDIEKLCAQKKKTIRDVSKIVMSNAKKMENKFPGMNSLLSSNKGIYKELF